MESPEKSRADLEREVTQLRAELLEAQETMQAICEGQVDALVISTPEGQRVFTLQGADQAYRAVVEQMQEGAVTLVEDGRIGYSNHCFARMVKRPLEEMIGSHIRQYVIERDHDRLNQLIHQALRGSAHGELTLGATDGSLIPVRVSLNLMVLDELPSICLIVTDLTERKQAERVLASEQFVRAILNQAADGVIVCDAKDRLLFANPAAQSMVQFDADNPVTRVSQLWSKVIDAEGRPIPVEEQSLGIALKGRAVTAREKRVVRSDGSYCDILLSANPLRDADGRIMGAVATFSDISRRKRAEEAERQQREWLRVTLASIGDAVIATDTATRVTFLNPVAESLTGWTQEQAIGHPIGMVFALVHEQTRQRADDVVSQVLRDKRAVALANDRALVTKDGCTIPIEACAAPILDTAGDIVGAVLVFHDVTAKRRARDELQTAKDAAERANRAKDQFLAVLSHELRTPLTPVVMGVSMLRARTDLDPAVCDILEMIHRNIAMEVGLIDDLLDVTRIANGKIEFHRSPVELSTAISRAVEICKPEIEARGLHFGLDMGSDEPYWVEADVPRLQQVFWNLLKNAVKFTPYGGCIGIRCRSEDGYVVAEVTDTGIGIEPEALRRIFKAFEQTDLSGPRYFGGLGLGLAICKALVELHGGTISAHSDGPGKGATLRVRLPLCPAVGPAEASSPSALHERAIRPLRILLVEDHVVTAKMTRMVLTTDGHTVETAGDVATALELAGQRDFDLLLSDLGLPDGSGHDLMRELRARGHNFPAIALSGYGQENDVQRSREAGFAAHLTKPASREAVVKAVASATAQQPPG